MITSDIIIFFSSFSLIYPTSVMVKGIAIRRAITRKLQEGHITKFCRNVQNTHRNVEYYGRNYEDYV